jgi:hypothetical protein
MARRRRQKRDWDKARGIVFMLIGLVLISALGGAWYWVSKNRTQLDAASNCPVTGPMAIHVILIDRSDPIQPLQAQQVRQTIDRYVKGAKIGERFDLYTANGDAGNVLSAVASVCNPGRGDQANELYQNPRMIQQQFEDKFLKPLESSLAELLKSGTAKESPILESIRAAAVASFGAVEPNTIPLQVTIISDLVQHSGLYSQFKTDGSFADLAKRPEWRSLQANLKGATVEVLYLLRADARRGNIPIQNRGHQEFWFGVFKANGADPTRVTITPL